MGNRAKMEGSPLRIEELMRKFLVSVVMSVLLLSWGRLAPGQSSPEEMNAALIQAAKAGNTQGARQVMAFGASVDAKDENDVTVLMWASDGGNIELMKLLLAKGANTNAKDKDGQTALDRAKAHGKTEAAKLLLAARRTNKP
jgi:ankyrin repeat protein